MKLHQLFCTVFFCLPALLFAQDPVFSQPLSAPTLLNPALVGGDGYSTFRLAHRMQTNTNEPGDVTSYAGVNYYFPKFNGSVGLNYMHDNAFETIKTTVLSLNYAQQFRVSGKVIVKPAIQLGYRQKTIDWSQLVFGRMIEARRGFVYTAQDQAAGGPSKSLDFNAGLLVTLSDLMLGIAVHHINEPNDAYFSGESPLPKRIAFQVAYTVDVRIGKGEGAKFQPYVLYHGQNSMDGTALGLGMQRKRMVFSIGRRGKYNLVGMVGFRHEAFHVAYSYAMSNSRGTTTTASAHEVTLCWNFRRNIDPHFKFVPMKSVLF
jgi:type IX secretion system PorP/SprF family membrane protein